MKDNSSLEAIPKKGKTRGLPKTKHRRNQERRKNIVPRRRSRDIKTIELDTIMVPCKIISLNPLDYMKFPLNNSKSIEFTVGWEGKVHYRFMPIDLEKTEPRFCRRFGILEDQKEKLELSGRFTACRYMACRTCKDLAINSMYAGRIELPEDCYYNETDFASFPYAYSSASSSRFSVFMWKAAYSCFPDITIPVQLRDIVEKGVGEI